MASVRPAINDPVPHVEFIGNHGVSSDELRIAMTGLRGGDLAAYSEDGLDRDLLLLSAYCFDRGYANVRIGTPRFEPLRNMISIPIDEGPRFTMRAVTVTGELIGSASENLAMIPVRPGDTFSRTVIADDREALSTYYRDLGYPDRNVLPLTQVDLETNEISLTFEVSGN